jgi:hypothetical protein
MFVVGSGPAVQRIILGPGDRLFEAGPLLRSLGAGRLPTEVAGFETHSGRICRTVFCFAQTRSPAIRY